MLTREQIDGLLARERSRPAPVLDRRKRPKGKRWYRCKCGLYWGKNKHFRCYCGELPPSYSKR